MAFKMKGSSYKMGGVKTKQTMAYMKSPLEQASPMKVAGGKFKFDDSGEYPVQTQISDQEYAEIQAKKAELEKKSNALVAERDAKPNNRSDEVYEEYNRKSEELYKDNPTPRLGTEGLDATEYSSIGELGEALSTMNKASQEYRDLKEIYNFETSDAGEKMTAEQRRLSMDQE
tara:strand:+ start:20 stop:538 length:519 start_codon:yes stop_codon:yes gene_type:complete